VTGLIRPDEGRLVFEGASLAGLRPNAIVGRGIARTFQSIRLFPQMTVLENVLVGEHCRLRRDRRRSRASTAGRGRRGGPRPGRARELLRFIGLDGKEHDLARNLPYGDQRRLEIARALATEPRLLLLDEPTAGMNPRETETLTRADRVAAAGARAGDPPDRARHGGRDGDLRPDHRTRLRSAHRGGHAGRDPRHPQVIEAYLGTATSASRMLELADVHTYYGNIRALRGVSLSVAPGEIVTLIGSNGAGKTTTLRTILARCDPAAAASPSAAIGSTPSRPTASCAWASRSRRRAGDLSPDDGAGKSRARGLRATPLARRSRPISSACSPLPTLAERDGAAGRDISRAASSRCWPSAGAHGATDPAPARRAVDGPGPILVETIFRIVQDINRQGTTILLVEQNARMALRVAHRGYVMQTGASCCRLLRRLLRSDLVGRKTYLGEK